MGLSEWAGGSVLWVMGIVVIGVLWLVFKSFGRRA